MNESMEKTDLTPQYPVPGVGCNSDAKDESWANLIRDSIRKNFATEHGGREASPPGELVEPTPHCDALQPEPWQEDALYPRELVEPTPHIYTLQPEPLRDVPYSSSTQSTGGVVLWLIALLVAFVAGAACMYFRLMKTEPSNQHSAQWKKSPSAGGGNSGYDTSVLDESQNEQQDSPVLDAPSLTEPDSVQDEPHVIAPEPAPEPEPTLFTERLLQLLQDARTVQDSSLRDYLEARLTDLMDVPFSAVNRWVLTVVDRVDEMKALTQYDESQLRKIDAIRCALMQCLDELGVKLIQQEFWDSSLQRAVQVNRVLPDGAFPEVVQSFSSGVLFKGKILRKQEVELNMSASDNV